MLLLLLTCYKYFVYLQHAPPPTAMAAPALALTEPDFSIDEPRRVKVVCIGAGFSGIIAGIR
jgi:hypothetical protein